MKKTLFKIGNRRRALFVILALFWLPLIIFGFLNLKLITSLVEADNFEKLKRAAEVQASSIELFIKSNYEQINSLANSDLPRDILYRKNLQTNLSLSDVNVLYSIYLTDLQIVDRLGFIRAAYDTHGVNHNVLSQQHFQMALSEKRHQIRITSEDKISPEVIFAAPILNQKNKSIGVIIIKYSASVIQEVISAHRALMGQGSYGLIVDHKQNVVGATNDFDLNYDNIDKFDPEVGRTIADFSPTQDSYGYSTKAHTAVSQHAIGKTGWSSIYAQVETATSQSLAATMQTVGMILALVLMLAMTSTILIYRLTKKLQDRESALKKANDEMTADLILGNQVQQALQYVPKLPGHIDFRWHQKAAKHVSGDLCFTHWNSALKVFTFMLIDVNGKGVQAALKASAFSSIAQSVWTSRDSYKDNQNRFDIFVSAANRFIKSTQFQEDFLAVVACEYHLNQNEARLFRMNYTAPLLVSMQNRDQNKSCVQRLNVPNCQTDVIKLQDNDAIVLLGDAFVGSSRQEKNIIQTIDQRVAAGRAFDATDLTMVVLDWHKDQDSQVDDQTVLVLKKVA